MNIKQGGFTLIELIVVIVILGILSATALPKFIDLGSDARKSVMDATDGAMRSANSMIYAKAASTSKLSGAQTVTVTGATGGTVGTTNGFATSVTELVKVMDIDSAKIDSAAASIFYKGYAVGTCGIGYTASAAASTPPTYSKTVSGC